MFSWLAYMRHSPYRFLVAAAVLAAILCLFPVRVDAPETEKSSAHSAQQTTISGGLSADGSVPDDGIPGDGVPGDGIPGDGVPGDGVPAGADLSEQTTEHTNLHRRMTYAPCGHSVQRREPLPAALRGMTRGALEAALLQTIPGASLIGFSAAEVDIAVRMEIPCPLHWVLLPGEDGMLAVKQNISGESLETVRKTDVPTQRAGQQALTPGGLLFDDVQAMEGYLESLSS